MQQITVWTVVSTLHPIATVVALVALHSLLSSFESRVFSSSSRVFLLLHFFIFFFSVFAYLSLCSSAHISHVSSHVESQRAVTATVAVTLKPATLPLPVTVTATAAVQYGRKEGECTSRHITSQPSLHIGRSSAFPAADRCIFIILVVFALLIVCICIC